MVVVKALLTSTSFATGFEGGPIFPLLFMGGTLGLAISKGLTFIPEGVAVTVGMAGVACAVFPLPLTISFTRAYGRTNRSIASNCNWGRHRIHSKKRSPHYFRNLIHSHLVMKETSSKYQNNFVPACVEIE